MAGPYDTQMFRYQKNEEQYAKEIRERREMRVFLETKSPEFRRNPGLEVTDPELISRARLKCQI